MTGTRKRKGVLRIMTKKQHDLHILIAERLNEMRLPGDCQILLDNACYANSKGRRQTLPVSTIDKRTRKSVYSWVDVAIISRNNVVAILEIEESGIMARKICGKIFAPALCGYCIPPGKEPVKMAKSVLFVQVLRDPDGIVKEEQKYEDRWKYLVSQIEKILSIKSTGCSISKYTLISGTLKEFGKEKGDKLKELIENHVQVSARLEC